MVDCIKQQREVHSGTKVNRCIHRDSALFMEIVDNDQCAGCPLMSARKGKKVSCEEKARKEQLQQMEQMKSMSAIEPDGEYPGCPFRTGGQGKRYCSISNLEVDAEICGRCNTETREHEARLGEKVMNYFGAVRRWVAKGKPTRSAEEIKKLFEEHCKGCERYDKAKHACKNCGCAVSTDSSPLVNKLAMASEGCPLGRF